MQIVLCTLFHCLFFIHESPPSSPKIAQAYQEILARLEALPPVGIIDPVEGQRLHLDLLHLKMAVEDEANAQVNRRGRQVSLESDGVGLFLQEAELPAENKTGVNWNFENILLEVAPRHLFIYDLRIKGSRTIRLCKLTLSFHDGPDVVFDQWLNEENGNCKAFSRRSFCPTISVWEPDQVPYARPLKAIHILGSAQDGNHSAQLSFQFTMPDPSHRAFAPFLEKYEALNSEWLKGSINALRAGQQIREIGLSLGLVPAG